jgi:protein-disulfide isomerase
MDCKQLAAGALLTLLSAFSCFAQASKTPPTAQNSVAPDQAQILKTTEAFVRNLYGWGPDYKIKVGPLKESDSKDFYEVPIEITFNDQMDNGEVYVSKDGKTMFRGDMFDMAKDPYAEDRAKLHVEGNPVKGPADASITLVEFGDFECPTCKALEPILGAVFEKYKVRLVFKDFPLEQVHPWAKTAAIGGRCAFIQSPDAFWKMHDAIYANQDSISPENVWDKLAEYAQQAGLNADTFKACMSSDQAVQAVEANQKDGFALNVTGTPTVFVNGRPVPGLGLNSLQQMIDFELAHQK